MITYVKGSYVNDYTVLYKEAVIALNKYFESLTVEELNKLGYESVPTDISISNLAEYFSYMKHLTTIDVDNNELKFTKLPLDEAHFVIDLNTRTITVPEDFKKNGIGVRGDEIAEIVYFEVDRYYDATDLNEQDIIIEWVNANGDKGYSRPYGKDVDLIPGKIVFGWPISSKVTPKDGNIKFAVRFYKAEDTVGSSGITYSLSTLVQSVKVNMDIDILLQDILNNKPHITKDDSVDVIKARAKNSAREDLANQPGTPIIYYIGEELGAEDGNGLTAPEGAAKATVVYITTSPDNEVGAVTISAGAYIDGDGVLTGSFWSKYKYFADGAVREVLREDEYAKLTDEERREYDANFLQETQWINYEEIPVVDAKAEIAARATGAAGILYYAAKVDGEGKVTGYQVLSLAEIDAMSESDPAVYRQDYTAELTTVGIYQFVAQVNVGSNEKQVKSDFILVFPPVRPKDVEVKAEGDKAMMEEDENGVFKATLNANMSEFGTELDEDLLPPSFIEYEEKKDLYPFDGTQEWASYNWYHNPNVKTAADALAEADWQQVEGADKENLVAVEEGYYKCGIIGHLNNSVSEEIISEPYRVTMPAARFVLTISGQDSYGTPIATDTDREFADDGKPVLENAINYLDKDGNVKGLTIEHTIEAGQEKYTDTFTYVWYQYTWNKEAGKDLSVDLEDAIKAMRGVYEPDDKGSINWPADIRLLEGVDENEFVPEKDGIYFCIVTNTYNEDTEVMCSPFMIFNRNDQ